MYGFTAKSSVPTFDYHVSHKIRFCFYSKNFQRLLRWSSYNFDALSGCHFEWKMSSFSREISHVIPRQPHKSWKKISVSEVRKWDFKLCWCWLLASKPWSEGFGWHGDESRNLAHMKMKTLNPLVVYQIFLYKNRFCLGLSHPHIWLYLG